MYLRKAGDGRQESNVGVNLIKVHYMHVWNYHNKNNPHCTISIY
jgi:hypothetical protein